MVSNLTYVTELIANEAPEWVCEQLAEDLDKRDRLIEELRLKSEWRPAKTAPKDGLYFIAWDSILHQPLFTMHWDGDCYLTAYEGWSGEFSHWMPMIENPEDY